MIKPKFYNEQKIEEIYIPRFEEIKKEALANNNIKSSSKDNEKVALLLIDFQIDFCNKQGGLYVDNSGLDIWKTINFILTNLEKITTIYPTLDSHLAYQIFYGSWWTDENNNHPAPFTIISKDEIEKGKYKPIINPIWSLDYINNLAIYTNKPLCIWPEHTMIGTIGHALVPALFEICYYHALTRKSQTSFQVKGDIPETEMYGIFSPEVKVPKSSRGGINTGFLKILDTHNKIIIAGEAKSHCVLESIKQLVDFFKDQPETLKKIFILEDCMSSVKHPTIDFEKIANEEFDKFRDKGISIVNSTDNIL
jgi:nicotinamidase/pyrazinamidase